MTAQDEYKLLSRLDFSLAWHGDANDPRYLASPCPRSSPLQGFATCEDVDEDWETARRAIAGFRAGFQYSNHPRAIESRRYLAAHPGEREKNRKRCRARTARMKVAA
jgi:hypothetical protein